MAAASSIQPPSVHSSRARENVLSPGMNSPEGQQPEDEEAAAAGAQPSEPWTSLRDLPELEPEEIEERLAKTRQELSNRRKILIKNLPPDTTNQEVHEILKEYELKYCFVDRNKGTAFVTLLNGDQAQDAIRSLHHSTVRGRLINVTLQPTDSLLCLTNLPHTFTAQQFEELVRSYGNIERSFLVYSDLTGHSKGYGFVEYMKKDSASRARSELLGRPLGDRSLMVQWMDVNQLSQEENLHSKCVCVDRLPLDLCDSDEMTQIFSETYKPIFCQLAQDEGSPLRGFGVVEYECAEQAESVLIEMDRKLVGGQEVRLSLCTPGTSGRSTLAALIAGQGMILSKRKGLLPEPNLAQLLTSMTNPAALQILMRPYHTGKRGGKYGRHTNLPFLRPPLTTALLTLGKAHQSAMFGNGLVFQNLLQMQLAQQQFLHIKNKCISSASSLLGDPSRLLMQKTLPLQAPGLIALGKGLLGDSPSEFCHKPVPASSHNATVLVSAAGAISYLQTRPGGEQNSIQSICTASAPSSSSVPSSSSSSGDRQAVPPGSVMQGHNYSLGLSNSGLCAVPPKPPGGVYTSTGHHNSSDGSSPANMVNNGQSSLLGEPPKDVRLPSNPYLNLASVMPGVVLQGSLGSKSPAMPPTSGLYGNSATPVVSQGSGSFSHNAAPPSTTSYNTDTSSDFSQYNQAYTQEAMQQWYQHYQTAQGYNSAMSQDNTATDYTKDHTQIPPVSSYGDYSSYMQTVTQCYSQSTATHGYASKEVDVCKPLGVALHAVNDGVAPPPAVLPTAAMLPTYSTLPLMPGFLGAPHPIAATPSPVTHAQAAATDWNTYYYNQTRGHKREYPQLAVQEVTSSDGGYIGQHSQGLGGQYADYFKRKRL
ncbi:ribonucleoprotein PTB-binding 2 isoform X3 [Phyllopteryx taeniolatus]|uniref:ribonucleoprotein PTB-binding 2 isoform X3 n=1 Tax=Phyllopteryx taeniolatus TaxID=161469 RepID=UPI002AD33BB4|nr:ribonucleoprotein PTB-binding 2 isoform X3 [Phyllopteryx taeniolatus]